MLKIIQTELLSGSSWKCNNILLNVFFDDKIIILNESDKVTIYLYEKERIQDSRNPISKHGIEWL